MLLPVASSAGTARAQPRPLALEAARIPRGALVTGLTAPSKQLTASVYLRPRDPAALATFVASVTDPHSARFGAYLAPGMFAARFGPTTATIARVTGVLRRAGLDVGAPTGNGLRLPVVGRAGAFERAFSTRIEDVRLAGGAPGRATTALELPAAVAPDVAAVVGLDHLVAARDAMVRHPLARARPRANGLPAPLPVTSAPGAPSACEAARVATELGFGGITDDEVAHAYGVDGLYAQGDLGQGQTIAIFELEPFVPSDLTRFDSCYFGADHSSRVSVVEVDGGAGAGPGSGEAALDVEDVSAIAPDAQIRVYEAPNTTSGFVDTYNQIVADDAARVVSTSWGLCEADELRYAPGVLAAESYLFEEAAAQGQTIFAASGDAGNDACAYHDSVPSSPVLSVLDPASQPYVVGVGGTTAVTVTQPPIETVWNDQLSSGASGGGISKIWHQPPWMPRAADRQSSRGPCAAPVGTVCRTVPDVSAFADELTGITIYFQGSWDTIGGTSSAAPLWAAMLADVNASAACRGSPATSQGVGFAAPLLYRVAADPATYASGFNDVTVGNNDDYRVTGTTYSARPGYDLATGLGTPELTPAPGATGPGLADSLCAAAQEGGALQVAGISPQSGSSLGGTRVTITGHGFMAGGVPDVRDVSIGTSPVARFAVLSDTRITAVTSAASTPTSSVLVDRLMRHGGAALVSVTGASGAVATGPSFHYVVRTHGRDIPTVVAVGPTGGSGRGGTVVHVYGSGFSRATRVTFGGVRAGFRVLSDSALLAIAPRWRRSMCAPFSVRGAQGLCQTEVRVLAPGGASPVVPELRPYAGIIRLNHLSLFIVPVGCRCEAYPTETEFDYTTQLSLERVTGLGRRPVVGIPTGGDLLVLHGGGFNVLTLEWVAMGPASLDTSQDYQLLRVSRSGSVIFLLSVADLAPSPLGNSVPVSVVTISGNTDVRGFRYLPTVSVSSLSTSVLPQHGGVALGIRGGGFQGADQVDFEPFLPIAPVQMFSGFTVRSSHLIVIRTPHLAPSAYAIYVCNTYSCGTGSFYGRTTSTLDVIAPSHVGVTSTETKDGASYPAGPVAGGTVFEIQGTNFGPLADLEVITENVIGETSTTTTGIVEGPKPTDPGATQTVLVTAPPAPGGMPGSCDVLLRGKHGTSSPIPDASFVYRT